MDEPKTEPEPKGHRRRQRITIGIVVAIAAAALASRALIKPGSTTPLLSPSAASSSSSSPSTTTLPSGPQAMANVTVYDDGTPAADRWVVFHDEAGTVTSSMKTGKDGKASGLVGPKSMVTAVYGLSVQHLVTVVGVEPNDQLVIGEDEDEGGVANVVCTALVSVKEKHPRAVRHLVSLGVGRTEVTDATKPTSMPVLKRFVGVDGKFRVLAEAVDASGKPIAFSHAWVDQCASTDASSSSPPPTKEVRLPAWSTDYRSFVLNPSASGASIDPLTAVAEFAIDSGEDRFDRGRREVPLIMRDAGQTKQASFPYEAPRALGTKARYKLTIAWDGSHDRTVLEERRDDMPETLAIDVDARMLPRVSDAVLDPSPNHPARPAVRWRIASSGQQSSQQAKLDATVVRLSWPAETREHVWTILLAPDARRVAVPALPNELASYRPNAREAIATSVAILEASFLDGFAEMKKKGLGVLEEARPEKSTLRYAVTGDLSF